ncbi:hypothetical protein [Halopenitus persicus]|uniref:DUF8112 domain-containing protein n=1 Tax=Halopenitus persicus TaxID=1048396 RepID=A0A1H3NRA3_9EURY|nr:hypothetical protein [Halopenitus persicus]SDY90975.1 hypothetical protein SAMN05216564_11428 [Halopenitus persicus]
MENSNPPNQEVVGDQLIEDISKIKYIALGEGPAACQVCDRELREGDELTAYAFRAAGNPIFEIGYVMCGADEHAHPTEFMRGVHELVVTGRVGLCSDVAVQSSWLVLLAPSVVVVSVASSDSACVVGDDTTRDAEARSTTVTEHRGGPRSLLSVVCEDTRADGGGW